MPRRSGRWPPTCAPGRCGFSAWCAGHGLIALPAAPETVALYLADLADRIDEAADGCAVPRYAVNTLQRRLATAAARAGGAERDSMRQTGHRSVEMVRRSIRQGSLFRDHPAGRVGL